MQGSRQVDSLLDVRTGFEKTFELIYYSLPVTPTRPFQALAPGASIFVSMRQMSKASEFLRNVQNLREAEALRTPSPSSSPHPSSLKQKWREALAVPRRRPAPSMNSASLGKTAAGMAPRAQHASQDFSIPRSVPRFKGSACFLCSQAECQKPTS